jgi:hypothetical protein
MCALPARFAGDLSVIVGCTQVKRDQIRVGACIDCVSERSDTAGTVGLKPDETPDTANSELSTDNSAADIDTEGTRGASGSVSSILTVCDCRAITDQCW